jgi:hypothetical protein
MCRELRDAALVTASGTGAVSSEDTLHDARQLPITERLIVGDVTEIK